VGVGAEVGAGADGGGQTVGRAAPALDAVRGVSRTVTG